MWKINGIIDGNVNIILENGSKILLPNIIKNVPSLLLPNHGNRVLTGGEILTYIELNNTQSQSTGIDEPSPFALATNVSDNISSALLNRPIRDKADRFFKIIVIFVT